MFSFENAKALVVGAAGGIGRALALEFARRGARVVAADIDESGAARTAKLVNETGGNAASVHCDITSDASLAAAVATAEDFLGEIEVSANAVGVLLSGNPEDIPLAEWERIFQVNLFGAARLNALVMPRMIARTRVPYAASKAALISMSENLAIYLKPKGVNVSVLCPGPTVTPIGGRSSDWTEGLAQVAPGRDYTLMKPQQAAQLFCDGMEAEHVLILSHEPVTRNYMQRFAAAPNNFIHERIGQFACGDVGLPRIDFSDPEIIEAFRGIEENKSQSRSES